MEVIANKPLAASTDNCVFLAICWAAFCLPAASGAVVFSQLATRMMHRTGSIQYPSLPSSWCWFWFRLCFGLRHRPIIARGAWMAVRQENPERSWSGLRTGAIHVRVNAEATAERCDWIGIYGEFLSLCFIIGRRRTSAQPPKCSLGAKLARRCRPARDCQRTRGKRKPAGTAGSTQIPATPPPGLAGLRPMNALDECIERLHETAQEILRGGNADLAVIIDEAGGEPDVSLGRSHLG